MSAKQSGHFIVPVFIPNKGCPHRCLFCEQEKITSEKSTEVDSDYVKDILETAIHAKGFDPDKGPEVAFYGGTFTNLPFDLMVLLLETVWPYIQQGLFASVRVSTRPDAMDRDTLLTMKDYGVKTVELGVQSMDDHVLDLSHRGHTSADTVNAVHILRELNFNVGIQLMPGLPGDSADTFRITTKKVIALAPDMVRLYPALVIKGTGLLRLYKEGLYTPLTLEKAIEICAESCMSLEAAGIPVIRMGLMSSPSLLEEGQIVDGPWHPAFGFLVRSFIYHREIEKHLHLSEKRAGIKIFARPEEMSLLRGYKNYGIGKIEAMTGAKITGLVPDETLASGNIRIE